MSVRKTISDSKGFFHNEFPYVIPSIYRKVVDEYLVELNLLSNQANFKIDGIFSYGLTNSFSTFTEGYQPKEHQNMILTSLCKACDVDYSKINAFGKAIRAFPKANSAEEFISNINLKNSESIEGIPLKQLIGKDNYYSRMHAIGIYELINNKQIDGVKEEEIVEKSSCIAKEIGYNKDRVTKDLSQYRNNLSRIKEAFELLKVASDETKRRIKDKE